MDDGECHVAAHVPPQHIQDLVRGRGERRIAAGALDAAEAEVRFEVFLAKEAMWREVRLGPDADGRIADADDILAAIRTNEALQAEHDAGYAQREARREAAIRAREASKSGI